VRVRLLGVRGGVGGLSDPAVRDAARACFAAELPSDPDARIERVERDGDGVAVTVGTDTGPRTERFELALVATGRVPNVDRLGLERTSLALDGFGVPVHDRATLQCGTSSIFLAGDAANDIPVLHEAADEGRIAGDNAALWPSPSPGVRRSKLAIVFSDPQIAVVGESWAQLEARDPVVGRVSFVNQGRSRILLQNHGLLHVYADRRTRTFLGAEMAGPRVEHLGHLLAWAHQQRLTIDQMLAMPFYHPVIEEGLRTALRDASAQLTQLTEV
jgi:dihydrolipoamide dehydrogenase